MARRKAKTLTTSQLKRQKLKLDPRPWTIFTSCVQLQGSVVCSSPHYRLERTLSRACNPLLPSINVDDKIRREHNNLPCTLHYRFKSNANPRASASMSFLRFTMAIANAVRRWKQLRPFRLTKTSTVVRLAEEKTSFSHQEEEEDAGSSLEPRPPAPGVLARCSTD
jgi:hypothetical protein